MCNTWEGLFLTLHTPERLLARGHNILVLYFFCTRFCLSNFSFTIIMVKVGGFDFNFCLMIVLVTIPDLLILVVMEPVVLEINTVLLA
jgi:hypothetical protein